MTDEELRDLQERNQLVSDLTSHPGWPFFVDFAHTTMKVSQQRIMSGMKDHMEYIKESGWLAGAFFILDIPEQLRQMLDHELESRAEMQAYLREEEEEEAA